MTASTHANQARTVALTVGAIGVVFGDIGTSPLYAMREAFLAGDGIPVTESNVLGIVSLIFWALVIVLTLKYLTFVMRADNQGEGGILALLALLVPRRTETQRAVVIALALFGAALIYGDGMITPAISVLSAVEGFSVATPAFEPYVIPAAVVILIALFAVQRLGTGSIGAVFGPVMIVWFGVIAVLGVTRVVENPVVFRALLPTYAATFFSDNTGHGFLALGSVFLVVTGSEALFADMGHFGRRPIAIGWLGLVFPSLMLNYAGQGATLLEDATTIENPFYLMAPEVIRIPMAVLATVATVIASQALISGAFSLTAQAVQLDYVPRLRVLHTSILERGQIYVPFVNWTLMVACIGLVIGFGSSSSLAGAYGVGVTTTMVIDSLLLFLIARELWHWPIYRAAPLIAAFLVVDLAFFGANLFKIPEGGWFPLLIAAIVFTLMSTWRRGRQLVGERLRGVAVSLPAFRDSLSHAPPTRIPGTVVFLHRVPMTVPPAMLSILRASRSLPSEAVVLAVITDEERPHVPAGRRATVTDLGDGFFQVELCFGFAEQPDVPKALSEMVSSRFGFVPEATIYVLGTERVLPTDRPGMVPWREQLFALLYRNASPAAIYFQLPTERIIEIGQQVEL
jgi:KUP system potassium uptake protein